MAATKVVVTTSASFLFITTVSYAQSQPRYYYDGNGNNIGYSLELAQNTFYQADWGLILGLGSMTDLWQGIKIRTGEYD